MSQHTEPREVYQCFGDHLIPCAADFPDTVNKAFNPGTAEIDDRSLYLYAGAMDAVVRVVEARLLGHLAQPPDLSDSPSAPAGRTPGTA
jgi:hypothetical protein